MMMRFAVINQQRSATERLPRGILRQPVAIDKDVYVDLDAWDGDPSVRKCWSSSPTRGLRDVAVCTGDFHHCSAGVLRPDFKDPSSPAVGVEFVAASVSSFSMGEIAGRDITALGRKLAPQVNPHLAYLDLEHHVYTEVIVNPTRRDVR